MTRKTRTLAQTDPRVVGGRYLCGYWRQEYTVTATEVRNGVLWLTCQWHAWTPDSHPRALRQWTDALVTVHCTAWDARRDLILAEPATEPAAF